MALKPALSTRGTISGLPAKATSCPRSVSVRAMPRLGGRLPPPDQFSQSILAIAAPPYESKDHPPCRGLCCSTGQAKVSAKQFPGIDIEGDNQAVQGLLASRALEDVQPFLKGLADPRAQMFPPDLEMFMHRGQPRLVPQPADNRVADLFVKVVGDGQQRIDVFGHDGSDPEFAKRMQRLSKELFFAAENTHNAPNSGFGAVGNCINGHLFE